MRNVVLARSLSVARKKQTRVVAAYADAPLLKTAMKVRTGGLGYTPLKDGDAILPMSYQRVIEIAESAAPSDVWPTLRKWVTNKIDRQRPANRLA